MRDEKNNSAIFQELSSSPAAMAAAKAADVYGLMPEHDAEQADALQAYTQALLVGTKTWVRLPKNRWPQAWIDAKMKDPVCPLRVALYGHPDSGGHWEMHLESKIIPEGFAKVAGGWRSVYFHQKLDLMLIVYVDDF